MQAGRLMAGAGGGADRSAPVNTASRLRARAELLTRELPGGEVVLTTADGATAVILNATAQAVVELCDGSRSVGEVARFVLDSAPDASAAEVLEDVRALVERLAVLGLLERVEPCGSAPSTV